jgi:hypothetical protein
MRASHAAKLSVNGDRKTVRKTRGNTSRKVAKRRHAKAGLPRGCVGADPAKLEYVRYLTQQFNKYRRLEADLGWRKKRISYAFIFESIRSHFKASIYFMPVERFRELADFIQAKIDRTRFGRHKRARCRSNYLTFDEHQSAQQRAAAGDMEAFYSTLT